MMNGGNEWCNELLVDVDVEMRAGSSARPPVNRDVAMMMHVLSSSSPFRQVELPVSVSSSCVYRMLYSAE